MSSGSEAFSRVLIDRALTDSGWDLLNPRQVRFETRARGRADYVLLDNKGMALCVLEAKREDHDPYDAKEQARGYAENLRAPFILLSNGREHWFWNYQRADQRDAYRIERLPSLSLTKDTARVASFDRSTSSRLRTLRAPTRQRARLDALFEPVLARTFAGEL
jgi:type I site-specific restriction endonuclease